MSTTAKTAFREALLSHMKTAGVGATVLARRTGVSKQVLDKLAQRRADEVKVADAVRLSAFFGKTVNQMIEADIADSDSARIAAVVNLLSAEERQIVLAQLEGLLSARRKR